MSLLQPYVLVRVTFQVSDLARTGLTCQTRFCLAYELKEAARLKAGGGLYKCSAVPKSQHA